MGGMLQWSLHEARRTFEPMRWFPSLDPTIQAAWIGVVGALIGSLLGAGMGATLASRAAQRAAREAWREEQRRALELAWADLHGAANRGSWAFQDLLDEPEKGEKRRQLELWADFWRHCKLVSVRAAAFGYPLPARFSGNSPTSRTSPIRTPGIRWP